MSIFPPENTYLPAVPLHLFILNGGYVHYKQMVNYFNRIIQPLFISIFIFIFIFYIQEGPKYSINVIG